MAIEDYYDEERCSLDDVNSIDICDNNKFTFVDEDPALSPSSTNPETLTTNSSLDDK